MSIDLFDSYWEEILSREKDKIKSVYQELSAEEQSSVVKHLRKMTTEDDWHPGQIQSALIALRALGLEGNTGND